MDQMNRAWTIRLIDILAAVLWVTAIGMLTWVSVSGNDGHVVGRWALLVGMGAVAMTAGAIGSWMVNVLRAEVQIGRLSVSRRGNGGVDYG